MLKCTDLKFKDFMKNFQEKFARKFFLKLFMKLFGWKWQRGRDVNWEFVRSHQMWSLLDHIMTCSRGQDKNSFLSSQPMTPTFTLLHIPESWLTCIHLSSGIFQQQIIYIQMRFSKILNNQDVQFEKAKPKANPTRTTTFETMLLKRKTF